MIYTVRFCHLSDIYVSEGDTVKLGNTICKMGDTGTGTGAHLHIDCIDGARGESYTLAMMEAGIVKPALRQLNYFIDKGLFGVPLVITTPVADAEYMIKYDKLHLAYDVVPEDRKRTDKHWDILWNRTNNGRVLAVGKNAGYGKYIHMGFEA